MKKIVAAASIAALAATAAFADVKVSVNSRIYADAYTYESQDEATTETNKKASPAAYDDYGTQTWFKDTTHKDDVTLSASGEKAGAKIVAAFGDSDANTPKVGTYQLWLNFGDLRLDAGTFDQRPINLASFDGNWGSNYCGYYKPGFYTKAFGDVKVNGTDKVEMKDTGDVSILEGAKDKANVIQAAYNFNNLLDLPLTVRADFFLKGTATATAADKSAHQHFVPFGVQAEYNAAGVGKFAYTGMLRTAGTKASSNVDYQLWTHYVAANLSLVENTPIMIGYALGHQKYSGGKDVNKANKLYHGVDFRIENKSIKDVSLFLNGNFSVASLSEVEEDENDVAKKAGKKDEELTQAKMGYWVTLGGQYKLDDMVTLELQSKIENTGVKAVVTDKDGKKEFNGMANMSINVRPAVHFTVEKNCILSAGVDVGFKGFSDKTVETASGKKDFSQFKTTISVPVLMRVKF